MQCSIALVVFTLFFLPQCAKRSVDEASVFFCSEYVSFLKRPFVCFLFEWKIQSHNKTSVGV